MKVRRKSNLVDTRRVPVYEEYDDIMVYLKDCIDVADWAGGVSHMMNSEGDETENHMLFNMENGPVKAYPGNWLVKTSLNQISVFYSTEGFWEAHDLQDDWFWKVSDKWAQRILPWLFAVSLTVATIGLVTAMVS